MIAVVDYGLGNLASVRNALRKIGAEAHVTADADAIRGANGVIVPGVGAASEGMRRMRARGLDSVVREVAGAGTPLLGVCLGMQLLFDRSEEGDAACLGLIPGTVRRLRGPVKIPHIGWNDVEMRESATIFQGLPGSPYFYFVHSYICDPSDERVVAGTTEYGERFCSTVVRGAVWGTQFHPERSGEAGLRLLQNFTALCRAGSKTAV